MSEQDVSKVDTMDRVFEKVNTLPEPSSKFTAMFGFGAGALGLAAVERYIGSGIDITAVAETIGSIALTNITYRRAKNSYKDGIRDSEQMIKEVEDFTFDL